MTSELQTENTNEIEVNRNEDIDSKIADFMADIDEIVLGKKTTTNNNHNHEKSEWKECFDETTQSIYYWNTITNECSWDPPSIASENHLTEKSINSTSDDGVNIEKKRQQSISDNKSQKKPKKPSIIAEYASSESETSGDDEENVDDIDELLNEVLDKEEKKDKKCQQTDSYPLFEVDCRAAIARLIDLDDKNTEIFTLRIQLETRLEDSLSGHLSKSYAVSKLEQALIQIEEFEKLLLTSSTSLPTTTEPLQPPLTSSDMALLLSLPPPPPPPSPPPPPTFPPSSSNDDDETLQLFYAQLNYDPPESMSSISDVEITMTNMKPEQHPHHHHHHHQKDKKSKPAKTLPTGLIQKWAHARQELRGIADIDDS
ncbi:unnamed protein product [Rotaria sp. Silwood2]|nr:unnamed protein product [Rotaria sp. Silwood2]CAF2564865.1 unnamed protein product [Rotaria sp. Silwood2]CAF2754316.1 unnamed protein product [Rotaria sp. Silwood2]CAF2913441.1 unnamed protein product [Rotaria sp. Silwood2]CAF4065562.1 unnamed protein product [Rotaria sp. Silwood2]